MGNISGTEEVFQYILNGYTIKNAYENWTEYREGVTKYLIRYSEPGKTIALLGIGEANDIDLGRLYEHTGNLTLVDKNLGAMKNALEKYSLTDSPNVTLVQKDFVGITDDEYKEIIDIYLSDIKRLKTMFSPVDTAAKIVEKMNKLYARVNSRDIDLGIEKHDYIVAIGVNSQLNSLIMNLWSFVLAAANKYETAVELCAAKQNDVFIPGFCAALENLACERLFVGVEACRLESKSNVQGAIQTINYFNRYTTEHGYPEDKCVIYRDIWPFMEGKTYEMYLFNIKKLYGIV